MDKIFDCLKKIYRKVLSFLDLGLLKIFQYLKLKGNYIVLESEGDFTDNIRVFYDYMIKHHVNEHYRLIWVVHNPRAYREMQAFRNVKFVSRFHKFVHVKAMYYNAVSKWFIVSHYSWPLIWKPTQIVINTCHSVASLKKTTPCQRKCCDYVLCCSEYTAIDSKRVFHLDQEHCLIIGMPRLDLLYKHDDCVHKLFPDVGNNKILLSMQTFKQSKSWVDCSKIDPYALNVISTAEEFAELDDFLGQQNYFMIIKIHHLQNIQLIQSIHANHIRYITDNDLAKCDVQVNQLLENADILLTDYSSVFYDFLLLDRPIGFLIGDITDYSRGFLSDDPLLEMPGEKINSLTQLKDFLVNCTANKDSYGSERNCARKKVYKYFDSRNCERLWAFIEGRNEI